MKKFFVAAALLAASSAFAGELLVHTVSMHSRSAWERNENGVNVEHKYNNVNPGLGYRTDGGWIVGVYKNSYSKLSVYGAKEFMWRDTLGVFIGAATGYEYRTGNALQPAIGFMGKYRFDFDRDLALNVIATPPTGSTAAVVHLALARRF